MKGKQTTLRQITMIITFSLLLITMSFTFLKTGTNYKLKKVIKRAKINLPATNGVSNAIQIKDSTGVTIYFLDGKISNSQSVLSVKKENIYRVFLLMDVELLKKYNAETAVCLITNQNKNSNAVKEFSSLINKSNKVKDISKSRSSKNLQKRMWFSIRSVNKSTSGTDTITKYFIYPKKYNQEEFKRVSYNLLKQGYLFESKPQFSDGKLIVLDISIKSSNGEASASWNSNEIKQPDVFIVATNSKNKEVSITTNITQ